MNDHAASDDRVVQAGHRDVLRNDGVAGRAVRIGLEVAEVSSMTLILLRQAVVVTFGVVMTAGALAVVETRITVLVNMDRMLAVR